MYFINKHSPKEFMKGIDFLREAVEKDPANPFAYAGLATGYAQMGHGPDPESRYKELAKAAALRAISLDSTLPDPYVVLAMIKGYYDYKWDEAISLFEKANSMNNSIAMSHFHYAWHLAVLGRYEEALKEHLIAKQLAPLELIYTADLGSLYYWMNKPDNAIREAELALEQDQNFAWAWWLLGNAYNQKKRFNKAIEAHKKAVTLDLGWEWALGNTYAMAGETEKAKIIIDKLESGEIMPRIALGLTFINISLGDMDEAYKWVNLANDDPWVAALATWPGLEQFRQDPRFNQFLIDKNLHEVKPYLETIKNQ
jgi:tetratricopeptide (TPR) repeat protein